jgi:hypothetical protein
VRENFWVSSTERFSKVGNREEGEAHIVKVGESDRLVSTESVNDRRGDRAGGHVERVIDSDARNEGTREVSERHRQVRTEGVHAYIQTRFEEEPRFSTRFLLFRLCILS